MKHSKVKLGLLSLLLIGFATQASEGVNNVLKLQRNGVDRGVIMAYINASDVAFDLSADEIQKLDDEGVPPTIVVAMIDHGESLRNSSPRPAATPTQNASPSEQPIDATYAPPAEDLNVSFFYEALSPHGSWHQDATYGQIWQPREMSIHADWRPYSQGGQWEWSDHGWYYKSSYAWGWAGFHYGRWYNHPQHHWVWVPGTQWAPSWVDWRRSDEYVGWAPLPPESHFEIGVGFSFRNKHVGSDFHFGLVENDYAFAPTNRFLDIDIGAVLLPRAHVTKVYNQTTVINNTYVYNDNRIINNGVSPDIIARATKREVKKMRVEEMKVAAGQPIARENTSGDKIVAYMPKVASATPRTPEAAIQRRAAAQTMRAERQQKDPTPAVAKAERKDEKSQLNKQTRPAISEEDARARLKQEKVLRSAPGAVKETPAADRKAAAEVKREDRKEAVQERREEKKDSVQEKREEKKDAAVEHKAAAEVKREEKKDGSQEKRDDAKKLSAEHKAKQEAENAARQKAREDKRDDKEEDRREKKDNK